jgi:hypothetical protein
MMTLVQRNAVMRRQIWGSVAASLFFVHACSAQIRVAPNTSIVFAGIEEGRRLLTQRDDYIAALSPFDRSARMQTDQPVDEKAFLEFLGTSVLAWSEADKAKVDEAITTLRPRLEQMKLPFPETIQLVLTSGKEEGGACYTRGSAIFIVKDDLNSSVAGLQRILSHELFHVLTRANPQLSERCYRAIGFEKCDEPELPAALRNRQISNPDAPRNDHCIRLLIDGKPAWVIPILLSRSATYDVARGGPFFEYVELKMLVVERAEATRIKVLYDNQEPRLVDLSQVTGLFEQVGTNTGYIIHPEEILADNFKLLVTGEDHVPSPAILTKLKSALADNAAP